jgi:hypothetical protein
MQHFKFGKLHNGNRIVYFKTKFIKSTKRDKGESASSATMELARGAVVQVCKAQVCDVWSFFCNLSKSLQESKVFFLLNFLDDTTTIFVML